MTKPVAVYRLVVKGAIRYIGVSTRPNRRFSEHKRTLRVPRAAKMEIISWHDSFAEAFQVEKALIQQHNPPMNLAYVSRPYRGFDGVIEAREQRAQHQQYVSAWDKAHEAARELEKELGPNWA